MFLAGGERPNVSVYVLNNNATAVTLACLVSSSVRQDYYIAWLEDGQPTSNYEDGINFPPQKTQGGFSVTSVYKTTKEKWNKSKMFYCNAWPAGSNRSVMTKSGVSEANDFTPESNLSFALSCIEDPTGEDELSSLWSTTSFFIFLFIFSLFYNMIFSLVKMKKQ
ncbi:uncharacterized protein AKAME5_001807100 [Lates japonicus]|uniref:Ig-like domain-containing protein n=1 Tax=Lates japonicus TaxID=270547 RepID=A0AAD3RG21_LATJO|nr:uncharacterized protein AKAME5_001807100 [Lates japonicus]